MNHSLKTLNNFFLILVAVITAASIFKYVWEVYTQNKSTISGKTKKRHATTKTKLLAFDDRIYYVILAGIALIGITIRIWKFGSVPGGVNQDGAMAAVDAKALAEYNTDRFGTWLPAHLYAWGYGQMSSLLSYIMAIFIKLFGLNTVTMRMPQLIISLAGATFLYLFIRDIFGKKAGLIAAAFVALNPWHLVQSRWALDCNLLPHLFMGGLYFLNIGLTKRKKMIYVSMIFFALCMYCYGITIYTIPIFLLVVCIYYFIKKRISISETLICAGIYLLIAWPFLLTMAVNFFKWDTIKLPFVTIQYFPNSVRSSDILFFSEEPLKQLSSNFQHMLNTTILQKKDLPWNDIEGFGTMFLCSIPFMVAGCVEIFRKKTDGAKALVVFSLLTGIWVGLLTNNVNVNRINIVYYGIIMFVSLGINFVIKELRHAWWINLGIYVILGVLLVSTYFGSYADMIKNQFYYGFGDALIAAEESGAKKIYVTADAQAKGYWNVSEILTLFYDKTDAAYFQGKKNENNGNILLPYKERFRYVSMSNDIVTASQREYAAYVILNSDEKFFDIKKYNITRYGRFSTVIKKVR